MDQESRDAGDLLIELPLDINTSRTNELGLFDRKSSEPAPSKPYQQDANQLLTQGSSLGAKLQSRLKLVKFGRHNDSCACLIILSIDFKPKSYTGVLRFRDATVTVKVQPGKGGNNVAEKIDSTQNLQEAKKTEPKIVTWHPQYLEGPAKSTLEQFNISIDGSTIPPAFGGPAIGPTAGYSMSRERVKRRIIHGTIEDEEQRILEWKLEENKTAGDGIPSACTFAFVVKVDEKEDFHVMLGIRAVTVAAIPVVGKNTGAIYFKAGGFVDSMPMDPKMERAWDDAVKEQISMNANDEIDFAKVDLALLTRAEDMIKN